MKKVVALLLALSMLFSFAACGKEVAPEGSGPVSTPTTAPAGTEAPVTEAPGTEPSVTEPPATEPLVTEPPVTQAPETEPAATQPIQTAPAVTDPTVTVPPVTEPSITVPPVTLAPGDTHAHAWMAATCTSPKTCAICGRMEGAVIPHDWLPANCTSPMTCKVCGRMEGRVAGHDWTGASCTSPKTCKRCGTTEGGLSAHNWKAATCTAPKSCTVCGRTEGGLADHNWKTTEGTPTRICQTCGKTEEKRVTLKVWAPREDQVSGKGWLNVMLAKFEAAHPEYKITWETGVCSEGDAGNNVRTDPEAAADVYFFANDQIGTLLQAGGLTKLGGSYLDQVKKDNSKTLLNTVTYSDGNVYGFPMTNNTWFMYYNKDLLTEEDVKSLDTMLTKGVKISFPMSTAWYGGAFFLGNGCTIFGEKGNDASRGFDFGGQKGYDAALKMVQIARHPNFVDDASGLGVAGLKEGTVAAAFTGSWDYRGLKEALGNKLGVVQPPMVQIGGKQVRMRSFAGSKCVGVNPHCGERQIAMELAAFLASEEAQLARYEMRGVIPSCKALINNKTISQNRMAVVEMETMNSCAVVQPIIPEMVNYWNPMGSFGAAVVNKDITEDNYMDMVDQLMIYLNASGL